MTLTRRHFLLSGLAVAAAAGRPAESLAAREPFPVFASDTQLVAYKFRRREVDYRTGERAGTIVIDTGKRYLYFVLGNGRAVRYGVGVGRGEAAWSGEAVIGRKAKWPVWRPTPDQLAHYKAYSKWIDGMPGGTGNPLGARAMYLYKNKADTLYRIHGTEVPSSIGKFVSSGCIRMINLDVIDLYDRVDIGTRVVVLPR